MSDHTENTSTFTVVDTGDVAAAGEATCPRCGATPGQPCDWSPFRSWLPHPERLAAATE